MISVIGTVRVIGVFQILKQPVRTRLGILHVIFQILLQEHLCKPLIIQLTVLIIRNRIIIHDHRKQLNCRPVHQCIRILSGKSFDYLISILHNLLRIRREILERYFPTFLIEEGCCSALQIDEICLINHILRQEILPDCTNLNLKVFIRIIPTRKCMEHILLQPVTATIKPEIGRCIPYLHPYRSLVLLICIT